MRTMDSTTVCSGCGLEFSWPPIVDGESVYCCSDCRDGYVCNCHEVALVEDEYDWSQLNAVSKYEGY